MKPFYILLFILSSCQLLAQENKITGKVTDIRGEPVANASVIVKNTLLGTTTNEAGTFSLKITKQKLPLTLLVSSVNYAMQEVQITAASQAIEVSLQTGATALNEVVTTASRIPENILQSPVSIEKMKKSARLMVRRPSAHCIMLLLLLTVC